MPRPPKPAALKAKVLAAVAVKGMSFQDAARKFKVSAPTVKRWVDAARADADAAKRPASVPPPAPAEPDAEDGPPPGGTTLEIARWMRDSANRAAAAAKRDMNFTAAASFARQAAQLMPVIAAAERREKESADTVRYSRTDIAEGMRALKEKFAALCSRPLLCAACSRELSASFAGYDRDAMRKLLEMGR